MVNPFQEPIDSFLKSLTYWQRKNLGTTLAKSVYPDMSLADAKLKATIDWSDYDQLKFELERALNSPE